MKMRKISKSERSFSRLNATSRTASRKRRLGLAAAVALAPLSGLLSHSARADTQDNVTATASGSDLGSTSSYASPPTTTSDITFTAATAYNGSFVISSAPLSVGTVDDLNTAVPITVGGTQSLTLNSTANVVSVMSADLIYVVSGGTLNISTSGGLAIGATGGNFDIAGSSTISSAITDSGNGFAKTGAGTGTLSGASSALTGNVAVNGGTLDLTSSIGGGTATGALTVGGGTFLFGGASSQSFAGLTVNPGQSSVQNAATGTTPVLTLGAISRPNIGGTVDFTTATASTHEVTTTTTNTNGIIGGWATQGGGATWAVGSAGGSPTAITGLPTASYTSTATVGNTASNYSSTSNVDVVAVTSQTGVSINSGSATLTGVGTTTISVGQVVGLSADYGVGTISALGTGTALLSATASGTLTSGTAYFSPVMNGALSVNSLRFNQSYGTGLTLTGTNVIGSGGILVTPTAKNGAIITGGNIESATNEMIFNFGAAAGSLTLGSVLANDGAPATSVTVSGPGLLNVTTLPTYTGGIFIENGATVEDGIAGLSGSAVFGTPSALTANQITVNNGSIVNVSNSNSITANQGITVNAGGLTINQAGNKTFAVASVITGVGGVTANEGGSAGLTLSGANTFTGGLTLGGTTAGVLTLSGANNFAGGFTKIGLGSISLTGGIANSPISTSGSGVLVESGAGTISGTSSIYQGSSGTSLLSTTATAGNTYSGTTTAAAGVLEFQTEKALYDQTTPGTLTATTANLIVQAGATGAFEVGNTGGFTAADITALNALGTSNGGFESGSFLGIDTSGASLTYGTAITDAGSNSLGLNKLGTNTLDLTGTNTYTGPTQITANTLQIGTGGSLGSGAYAGSILDKGTLEYSSTAAQTLSGSIGGGSGGLTKDTSTSTLTLTAVNTFTGATAVTAGVLDLANSLALQTSSVTYTAPGSIVFDSLVTSNAFTFGSVGTTANNSYLLQNNAGSPAAITLTIGNPLNSQTSTTSGVFSGTGGNLTLTGFNNTITLTGANSYTGTTTVTGSTLNLGGAGANGSISSSSPLVLGGGGFGGTLAYTRTGTVAQTFNGATINAGPNAITTSTATQTLNLGALTGNPGGTVDINPFSGSAITTTSGNTNGIIGGFATYGGKTTWAVSNGGSSAITPLASGSYTESGSAGTTAANYTNANIDVNASEVLSGPITPNSLRFNTNAAETLTLTGANEILSGGILVTPTVQTVGSTITGGTLFGPAGGQLSITQAGVEGISTSPLSIASLIVDNGGASSVAVSAGSGGRAVGMSNASNSFSGGFYLNGGGVNVPGADTTALGVGNVYFGNNIYTGSSGGGITFGTNTNVLTSGLISAASGTSGTNGEISGNSGGIWNLLGLPSATETWAGVVGTYSGSRVANFAVDSGTEIIGNTQLGFSAVIANGGTYQLGTGYWGSISNTAQNVSLTVGGGNFIEYGNLAGFTAQPFNSGLVVNPGASTVTVNNNNAAGTVVNLAAAGSRSVGGTVNFVLPSGTQDAINGITTTTLNTNGILGGYATVGGTDWATNATNLSGGNIIGLSASSINSYSVDTFNTGLNTDVQGASDSFTGTTDSLRFNTPGGNVIISGAGTVTSGGILATANLGSGGATISGGTIEGAPSADLVVIQNDGAGNLTIGSQIINNGTNMGLTKSGSGLLTLSPSTANTFSGGLFLNGGTVNLTSNGFGSAGSIAFNGGALQLANAITTSKNVSVGVNGGTIDLNGNALNLSGTVTGVTGEAVGAGLVGGFAPTGVGLLSVVNSGAAATLQLTHAGSGTFSGGLSINGSSTVQNGALNALGTGYVTFGASGTPTVDLDGNNATVAGLIGGSTNGIVTTTAGTPTLTLDGVFSQTFAGSVQGSAALTVALSNLTESQIFSGSNSYTGATAITSGTLGLSGSISGTSGIATSSAGAFNETAAGTVSGAATFTQGSNLTSTLAGSNAYTGATTITGGNLILTGSLTSTSSITTSGTGTFNESTAGAISGGSTTVTQGSSGTSTLAGSNTYAGGTTVNAGTLSGTIAGAFGTGFVTVNPTGISNTTADAATLNTNGAIASTAAVTVNSNSAFAIGTAYFNGTTPTIGSLAGTGKVVLNNSGGTALTTGNASNTTFAGVISDLGTHNGSLAVAGTGSFTLTNANTYGGSTTINAGATLALGDGTTDGSITNTSGVSNSGSLVYNLAQANRTVAYAINGTGSLTLVSAGNAHSLTLTSPSSYGGGTTITSGTLFANTGLTGTGAVSVNNTATLAGTGSVAGAVTVANGATISPGIGNAANTLTTAAATINGTGNFLINSTTNLNDELISTGVVALTGSSLISLTDASPATTSATFVLIDAQGGFSGTFSNLPDGGTITVGPNTYTASYDTPDGGGGMDLTISAVPEPTSLGLLALGGLGLMRRRRRVLSKP
jgi:autotransporter-associated beta strand protein